MSRDLQPSSINPKFLTVLWLVFALSLFLHIGSTHILRVRVEWTDAVWFACTVWMAWIVRLQFLQLPKVLYLGAVGFLLAASMSLLVTPGLGHFVKYLGYWALTVSALLCWIWTCRYTIIVRGALRWLLLLAVVTTLAGWLLALVGVEGWGARKFQGAFYFLTNRATGLTNHPNRAALVLLVFYGLYLLQWQPRRGMLDDILLWLTPWVGLITLTPFSPLLFAQLGAAGLAHASRPVVRRFSVLLITGAVLGTMLLAYVVPIRGTDGAWQLRAAPRTLIQGATVDTLGRAPWFGQGLATKGSPIFSHGYPPTVIRRAADPHNAYLDLLATGGVFFLFGFALLVWSLTRPPEFMWRAIVASYLWCGLVHSINDERMFFFGLGVGAAMGAIRTRDERASRV